MASITERVGYNLSQVFIQLEIQGDEDSRGMSTYRSRVISAP
jgi:hypothetical protein